MNLVGDLRYVSRGEYAAFAGEESAEERERWFRKFRSEQTADSEGMADDAALRAQFDKSRPPGFFGHRHAFSSKGKYGQWLLQKPLMVVINDSAFVHGGLPPLVAKKGLTQLNDELRLQVRDYVKQINALTDAELIDPATNFYDHAEVASHLAADSGSVLSSAMVAALQAVIELNNASVHDASGPLWYRGTVACSTLSEGDVVLSGLQALGVSRIVVGHTPTVTRRVLQRFGGRVIEVDTGMLKSSYHGVGSALIIEGGSIVFVSEQGPETAAPIRHPRRVGLRADILSTVVLEQILASADIVSTETDQTGRTIVILRRDGSKISAVFTGKPRKRGLNTELAAYRLDKLLGLDMVPVTVAREVNGKHGTLQYLPDNTQDEAARVASGRGGSAHCPLPRQWNSMYIFDALIYNESRSLQSMVYNKGNWQLMSMGHARAFSTKRNRPAHLARVTPTLTSTWIDALSALSDETLTEHLGDVLDKKRITALGKRRDLLLSDTKH
jgi:hypothetical protein